jgi:hypothetical protein
VDVGTGTVGPGPEGPVETDVVVGGVGIGASGPRRSSTPVYSAFGAPRLGVGSNSTQPKPVRYTSGQAWA